MKYLKLYEDHGDKLYYGFNNIIEFQDFRKETWSGDFDYFDSIVDIDQVVVNSVKGLLKEIYGKRGLGFTVSIKTTYITGKRYIQLLLPYKVKIHQFEDEWFDVEFFNYYWCDQVDGLMQCLKDNLKV